MATARSFDKISLCSRITSHKSRRAKFDVVAVPVVVLIQCKSESALYSLSGTLVARQQRRQAFPVSPFNLTGTANFPPRSFSRTSPISSPSTSSAPHPQAARLHQQSRLLNCLDRLTLSISPPCHSFCLALLQPYFAWSRPRLLTSYRDSPISNFNPRHFPPSRRRLPPRLG